MAQDKNIVILGTGGTIAGVAGHVGTSVGYRAAQLSVADLLSAVPSLESVVNQCTLQAEQLVQLDSKDMDAATWRVLALRCAELLRRDDVRAIVITHGTDTLEETAWFLQCVLQPSKPVVLTCAMRPATALSADGPANLRDAVVCAADRQAACRGVLVVVGGSVLAARDVRKVHPYRLDAFDGGEGGTLGWVEEARVRWQTPACGMKQQARAVPAAALLPAQDWPQVEVVLSHAGSTGAMVAALCGAGARGLVVAGTGNGTLHQCLEAALQEAQNQGVAVRRTTRCEQGRIVQEAGAQDPCVSVLSPVKARISLMLELMGWPRMDE